MDRNEQAKTKNPIQFESQVKCMSIKKKSRNYSKSKKLKYMKIMFHNHILQSILFQINIKIYKNNLKSNNNYLSSDNDLNERKHILSKYEYIGDLLEDDMKDTLRKLDCYLDEFKSILDAVPTNDFFKAS